MLVLFHYFYHILVNTLYFYGKKGNKKNKLQKNNQKLSNSLKNETQTRKLTIFKEVIPSLSNT